MFIVKYIWLLLVLVWTYLQFNLTGFAIQSRAKVLPVLEKIYKDDQKYRTLDSNSKIDAIALKLMDRINLLKVQAIFNKFKGWPTFIQITDPSHIALFLVIQHSPIAIQKHYLELFKNAVAQNKLKPAHLALLEDRIAVNEGRPQIYGSQIGKNPDTGEFFVQPIDDLSGVDERRRAVGLPPLKEYVLHWNIIWDS